MLLGFIKQKNAEKNFIRFVPRWQCESPYYEAYGSFTDDSPWHRAKDALLREEEDAY